MDAAGNQVIPGTFGAAGGQDRGLKFGKALLDHALANRRNHCAAQANLALHLLAPQVEVPVTQADLLARIFVGIYLQRQHLGARLQLGLIYGDLDLACGKAAVHGLRGPLDHRPGHRQHAFDPRRLEQREQWARYIDHTLREAETVAQIDEKQLAMIALAVNPTGQADHLPGIGQAQRAAIVTTIGMHGKRPR